MMMDNILHNVFKIINKFDSNIINYVDVGVYKGNFLNKIKNFSYPKKLFSMGVDPCDQYGASKKYNIFYNYAVDDVDIEQNLPFNFNEDCDACSSLLRLNQNDITHNISDKNIKWYCPVLIEKIDKVELVKVDSLTNLLDKTPHFKNNRIHYLKIDAEGVDIRVVRSAKKYLDNTLFVQIETVSDNSSVTLFEGQTKLSEDNEVMSKFGFELFDYIDYSSMGLSPNVDAVFINRNIKL